MPRYKKEIWAGDVYECEEYFSPRTIGAKYERGANELLTTEEQKERNLAWGRKKLSRLINENFGEGDLFITLTYAERIGFEKAKKKVKNFIRRLKRFRTKHKEEKLKYIMVTETGSGREHHHMVINAMEISLKELRKLWGLGRVLVSTLDPHGDYTGLSHYITKETTEEQWKRWSSSTNLNKPKIKVRKMKKDKSTKKLTPPKGYRVLESNDYFSEAIGTVRYLKALKEGGYDYGEGESQLEHTDGQSEDLFSIGASGGCGQAPHIPRDRA